MKRKLLFCVALFTLSSSYSMEKEENIEEERVEVTYGKEEEESTDKYKCYLNAYMAYIVAVKGS